METILRDAVYVLSLSLPISFFSLFLSYKKKIDIVCFPDFFIYYFYVFLLYYLAVSIFFFFLKCKKKGYVCFSLTVFYVFFSVCVCMCFFFQSYYIDIALYPIFFFLFISHTKRYVRFHDCFYIFILVCTCMYVCMYVCVFSPIILSWCLLSMLVRMSVNSVLFYEELMHWPQL